MPTTKEKEKFIAYLDERMKFASSMATRTAYQIVKLNYITHHAVESFTRDEVLAIIIRATGKSKRNAVIEFNKWYHEFKEPKAAEEGDKSTTEASTPTT